MSMEKFSPSLFESKKGSRRTNNKKKYRDDRFRPSDDHEAKRNSAGTRKKRDALDREKETESFEELSTEPSDLDPHYYNSDNELDTAEIKNDAPADPRESNQEEEYTENYDLKLFPFSADDRSYIETLPTEGLLGFMDARTVEVLRHAGIEVRIQSSEADGAHYELIGTETGGGEVSLGRFTHREVLDYLLELAGDERMWDVPLGSHTEGESGVASAEKKEGVTNLEEHDDDSSPESTTKDNWTRRLSQETQAYVESLPDGEWPEKLSPENRNVLREAGYIANVNKADGTYTLRPLGDKEGREFLSSPMTHSEIVDFLRQVAEYSKSGGEEKNDETMSVSTNELPEEYSTLDSLYEDATLRSSRSADNEREYHFNIEESEREHLAQELKKKISALRQTGMKNSEGLVLKREEIEDADIIDPPSKPPLKKRRMVGEVEDVAYREVAGSKDDGDKKETSDVEEQKLVSHEPLETSKEEQAEPTLKKNERKTRKRTTKQETPREKFFDERFEREFGISRESLAGIEGFERLSKAQQKLVFENFSQLTLGNVREDTARLISEKAGARREEAIQSAGKFFGNIAASFRNAFETNAIAKSLAEKRAVKKERTEGFEAHEELLRALITGMAEHGPRVHENAEGELEVDFVNLRERAKNKELRDEEWFATIELNQAANSLAKMPRSWKSAVGGSSEDSKVRTYFKRLFNDSSLAHEEAYEKEAARYQNAQKALEQIFLKKGMSEKAVVLSMIDMDRKVSDLQTLRSDPDALKTLGEIEDRTFFKEAWKSVKGKGFYFGLGYALRSVAGAGLGVLGAPLVAGGMRYATAWNESEAKLRERDRNAARGIRDTEKGALNMVNAETETQKTRYLLSRVEKAEGEEKQKLLSSLHTRLEYLRDKQMLGRVDYGEKSDILQNQKMLAETMGEAIALYTALSSKEGEEMFGTRAKRRSEKLTNLLNKREATILKQRSEFRDDHRLKAAAVAGGFSLAGALVSSYMKGDFDYQSAGSGPTSGGNSGAIGHTAQYESWEQDFPRTQESWEQDFPKTSSFESAGRLGKHQVVKGNTVIGLMKQFIVEDNKINDIDTKIANFLKTLKSDDLREIGIQSGDVNKIRIGDSLDLEKLKTLYEERGGKTFIPDVQKNGMSSLPNVKNEDSLGAFTEEKMRASDARTNDPLGDFAKERVRESDARIRDPLGAFAEEKLANQKAVERGDALGDFIARQEKEASLRGGVKDLAEKQADSLLEIRSQGMEQSILKNYNIAPRDWWRIRQMPVREVLSTLKQNEGQWFEFNGRSQERLTTMKNFETIVLLAKEKGVEVIPKPNEKSGAFLERFTTSLVSADETRLSQRLRQFKQSLLTQV